MRNVDALRRQADAAGDVDRPLRRRARSTARCRGRACGASTRCSASCAATARARVTEVCTIALAADMLDVHRLEAMLEHGVAAAAARRRPRASSRSRAISAPPRQYALPLARASGLPKERSPNDDPDVISPDLKTVLRRLKLSRMLDTLPERLTLARQQKMPHQDLLLLVLSDEVARRDSLAVTLRVQKARLDPDDAARALGHHREGHLRPRAPQRARLAALPRRARATSPSSAPSASARPFSRTPSATSPAGAAPPSSPSAPTRCSRRSSTRASINSYEAELRKLIAVDLLILDDFAIDVLDPIESRDLYDLLLERYRTGSIIVTSNRGPDEWLATFADPVRAQSAIDRFTSNAYDLVIEGESYRPRLKPTLKPPAPPRMSQAPSSDAAGNPCGRGILGVWPGRPTRALRGA